MMFPLQGMGPALIPKAEHGPLMGLSHILCNLPTPQLEHIWLHSTAMVYDRHNACWTIPKRPILPVILWWTDEAFRVLLKRKDCPARWCVFSRYSNELKCFKASTNWPQRPCIGHLRYSTRIAKMTVLCIWSKLKIILFWICCLR